MATHPWSFSFAGFLVLALAACSKNASPEVSLLNVSYDPTRELYSEINPLFVEY